MISITALQSELGRAGFTLAVVVVLITTLLVVRSFRRRGALRVAAVASRIALAVAVLGVLSLTLVGRVPMSEADRILILDPIEGAWGWDSIAWRPVFDNVVMFVPIGALTAAVRWRRSAAAVFAVCLVFSVSIEAFQYLVPTGRVANTADLVANGTGALLGMGLAAWIGVRRAPAQVPTARVRRYA